MRPTIQVRISTTRDKGPYIPRSLSRRSPSGSNPAKPLHNFHVKRKKIKTTRTLRLIGTGRSMTSKASHKIMMMRKTPGIQNKVIKR
jgi:hypothetical protein